MDNTGNTHVTQKSETLRRWQAADSELRNDVLQSLFTDAGIHDQHNKERARAFSTAYCLLIEMASV